MNSGGFLEVQISQYRDYYFLVLNISVLTVFPQLHKMLEVKVTPFFPSRKILDKCLWQNHFLCAAGIGWSHKPPRPQAGNK